MKELKLKPCHSCGCPKAYVFEDTTAIRGWCVFCERCGSGTAFFRHRRSAIRRWNKRAGEVWWN
jgi:Lar family restriction alleviation protein